jgi:hypothetical protein
MIYQHRLVIARGGRLVKRHEAFQKEALAALDDYGSVLIGAWEVWIGPDAGCAVWQLRQFESLTAWEQHQERVRQDRQLSERRTANLYPYNDFVDTSIVRAAERMQPLPETWPAIQEVRGQPRGFIEQRVIFLRPDTARQSNEFYFEMVAPALNREDSELIGYFDTVIGPGTTNAGSHRSIELRRFPDLSSWQRWREVQDNDAELAHLVKEEWLSRVERVDTTLLRPLDYSRIR